MQNEKKTREMINKLAQSYRREVNSNMTHEQAKKRVIKAITKKQ